MSSDRPCRSNLLRWRFPFPFREGEAFGPDEPPRTRSDGLFWEGGREGLAGFICADRRGRVANRSLERAGRLEG